MDTIKKLGRQLRSAFSAPSPIAVVATVVVTTVVLAGVAFMAVQLATHTVGTMLSLMHAMTSGTQSAACGLLPGSCYTPQA